MKAFTLLLLTSLVLGSALAQRITVPLKINDKDQLFFTVKYGSKQCEANLLPTISFCSNVITETFQQAESCGSVYVGQNGFVEGNDYMDTFQLGDTSVTLYYSVPSGFQSMFFGAQELCFGFQSYQAQKNTLVELFQAGKITEERFYFSLNTSSSSNDSNATVGTIDIGAPNKKLIKKGSKLALLKNTVGNDQYSALSNRNLSYGTQSLDSRGTVFFSLDSPFSQITSFAFDAILTDFQSKGIEYTYLPDQGYAVFLPSIEGVESLSVTVIQQDSKPFIITLQPSQITRLLPNGQYQLLIQPLFYTGSISIGYSVFESYYVGFDLPHQFILIAEKGTEAREL